MTALSSIRMGTALIATDPLPHLARQARGDEGRALLPARQCLDFASEGTGGFTHVWSDSR